MFLTSTPKKAVVSHSNSIQCLVCAAFIETTDRIAVFGRSQCDLRGTIGKILNGELQTTNQGSQYVCRKKCFPKLRKFEKMSTNVRVLEDELREEMSRNAVVRIKRGLSEDRTQESPLEQTSQVSSKPIKKTLFPPTPTPTLTQNVESLPSPIVGFQAGRPTFGPVLVRAFPACANNLRNFPPEKRVELPSVRSTTAAIKTKETVPQNDGFESPSVQVR